MSELFILIALVGVFAVAALVAKLAVNSYGHGRRRPPLSHRPDMFDAETLRRVH